MPFTPLTSEQIADAVEGAIQEGAESATATTEKRLKVSRGKKWLDRVTVQLNEMLANPRFAFRRIETLATAFDDEAPFALTRGILKRLPGVRRSTLQKGAMDQGG